MRFIFSRPPARLEFICGCADPSSMLDTILLAAGVGFFVLAVFYVLACEKM
jgi:hypothetical protein